jgi:hypothetical protein
MAALASSLIGPLLVRYQLRQSLIFGLREKWISDFQSAAAEFIAVTYQAHSHRLIHSSMPEDDQSGYRDHHHKQLAEILDVVPLASLRLALLLKLSDPQHQKLFQISQRLMDTDISHEEFLGLRDAAAATAASILRTAQEKATSSRG